MKNKQIVVIDFGGQYAHLISRRFRQLGFPTSVIPFNKLYTIKKEGIGGAVLSGGPASVYDKGSPKLDFNVLNGLPILGICYGLQLIATHYGGKVKRGRKREYGRAKLKILAESDDLLKDLPREFFVWMSHTDEVTELPKGFEVLARTDNSPYAVIKRGKIYGLQFHPEVSHTENGLKILENFAKRICEVKPSINLMNKAEEIIEQIRKAVGKERVICAVSGGIDSTLVAYLLWKAIGKQATFVFVDHGLLRKGEAEAVLDLFDKLGIRNLVFIKAADRFLKKLKGVEDPEKKRKIIGDEFVKIFEEVAEKRGPFEWLAQGTLYPDVI